MVAKIKKKETPSNQNEEAASSITINPFVKSLEQAPINNKLNEKLIPDTIILDVAIGDDNLIEYLKRFGLSEKSAKALLPVICKVRDGELDAAAIVSAVEVKPAFAAVASGPGPLPDNPIRYADRKTQTERPELRSMNAVQFLEAVWGPWIKAGVVYQDDLRRSDFQLVSAVHSHCQRLKIAPKDILPPSRRNQASENETIIARRAYERAYRSKK